MLRVVLIGAVIGYGVLVFTLPVITFAPPEVGVAPSLFVVGPHLDGAGKELDGIIQFHIGKGLRSQLEKDILLGIQNLQARMLDLFDRFQCRIVILGGQVSLHQVIIHFVGILRVRIIVQKIFEYRNRLAKTGKGRFMDQQRVIIHRHFTDLAIERRSGRGFERHTCLVLVVQLQISLS